MDDGRERCGGSRRVSERICRGGRQGSGGGQRWCGDGRSRPTTTTTTRRREVCISSKHATPTPQPLLLWGREKRKRQNTSCVCRSLKSCDACRRGRRAIVLSGGTWGAGSLAHHVHVHSQQGSHQHEQNHPQTGWALFTTLFALSKHQSMKPAWSK
jgi:hypothetical protein